MKLQKKLECMNNGKCCSGGSYNLVHIVNQTTVSTSQTPLNSKEALAHTQI